MTPRKSAKEISDQIISQLEASLNTTIPLLPRSFSRTLAKSLGGIFVTLYQYSGWILLQRFVKTASDKSVEVNGITINPLQTHGEQVDILKKTGQRAELTVEITVLTQGGTITSGERIANSSTQMVYVVVGDVALDEASVIATIRATKPGVLGNVDIDTETLSFVSPPDAVEKNVLVTGVNKLGVDPEETEAYRERILERWMARPQGGSYADYKNWAEEVIGVRNAYPYSGWANPDIPGSRAGQVFVYIESDTTPDGEPDQSLLNNVDLYLEGDGIGLANRRNINAQILVMGISRKIFDVEISGLHTDNNNDAMAAIEEGLTEFCYDREPGGQVGYTVLPPRKDIVTKTNVGGVVARIAAGYSGYVGGVTVKSNGSEIESYGLQEGEKAKLGTITWT